MTREQAKELLPLIKAFVEGKTIEELDPHGNWKEAKNPIFTDSLTYSCIEYRIKPELKCRPFKNKEECWNEMMEHQPFGWVVDKFYNFCHIGSVYSGKKETYGVRFYKDGANYDYEYMLKEYKFADGTPFGIKEE